MRKILLFLLFWQVSWLMHARAFKTEQSQNEKSFSVTGDSKKYSVLKNLLLCKSGDKLVLEFAKIIRDDLDFTDQFDVMLQKTNDTLNNVPLKKLFDQGTSLVTFFEIKKEKNKRFFQTIVKDTSSGLSLFDKKVSFNEKDIVMDAHLHASDLLKALTGDKGVCLSSLAYCKTVSSWHKVICISDYACKKNAVVVPTKTINLAPRWHTKVPVLFYSQVTRSNNRLMSFDLRTKKHNVICSYEGLNMQPAFSKDGKRSVVCMSGGRGNAELYLYDPKLCKMAGKRVFQQLTRNGSHNVSPTMLPNGDVVFCSDYKSAFPQIYYLSMHDKKLRRLTSRKGGAAAPSYCARTNMLVYTRPVSGTFQLFTLSLDDLSNVHEAQITFCKGNKHEPCWSDDGRYIVCSLDRPNEKGKCIPQIAALNYKSGKIRILTHSSEPKSFPQWTSKKLL